MDRTEAIEIIRKNMPSDKSLPVYEAIQTLVPELAESEDEKIRKILINIVKGACDKYGIKYKGDEITEEKLLAYLEKQKERGPLTKEEEYILHRIIEYLEDETCPSEWISLLHDIYCLPYEKQKEASKAIEAIEKIDKYIDENLANAHDMKDSNPDKKYYRGWDDALGEMSGILQDVYSEKDNEFAPHVLPCSAAWFEDSAEKQKEQKLVDEQFPPLEGLDAIKAKYYDDGFKNGFDEGVESVKPAEWKPSEEQMEAFKKYIEEFQTRAEAAVGGWNNFDVMIQLYEQLKKL